MSRLAQEGTGGVDTTDTWDCAEYMSIRKHIISRKHIIEYVLFRSRGNRGVDTSDTWDCAEYMLIGL